MKRSIRRSIAVVATSGLFLGCGSSSSHSDAKADGSVGGNSGATALDNTAGGAANSGGQSGANGGAGTVSSDGGVPSSSCSPVLTLVDTSHSDHVVGTGSVASCTEAALRTQATLGGIITFDCGGPATIAVTKEIELSTSADTTIDGGGTVTLDGGGVTRILDFNHGDYRKNKTVLTLQRIALQNGKSTGTQIPVAPAPCSQGTDVDGGGSALYVRDGVLHLIDATFTKNQAPAIGPDVGGAVYVLGSLGVVVQGSTFQGNTGANGGALYMLNSDLQVVNSTFSGNKALGTGENSINAECAVRGGESGNGGNAGAVAIDGGDDGDDLFCGVTFSGNQSNELGGAIGRTPDGAERTTTFDRCTFDGNQAGSGGSMYFHNSKLVVTASTFSNNSAKGSGAIQADGTDLDFMNVTFSGNSATNGLGGAIALFSKGGSLVNCTFASNKAEGGSGLFGAAIAGNPTLTIRNTIFSDNTSKDCGAPMACQDGSSTGDGNLQWPSTHTVCTGADPKCTPSTTYADAKLGPLADNGGPTLTRLPGAGSPAIGEGTACPATDQRGHTRPATGCAAGAIEP